MEFCTQGDLRTYLRRSRKKNQKVYTNVLGFAPMPRAVQLKFALDVASGMAHLAERQVSQQRKQVCSELLRGHTQNELGLCKCN